MKLAADFIFINEEFHAEHVSPRQFDLLLANGWRHFGTHFFRYNLGLYEYNIRRVIPLRIRLSDFSLSKSQRRTLSQNADVEVAIHPIEITSASETLFDRHKTRFRHGRPASIYDFLSYEPATVPVTAMQISVSEAGRLIAASYFDTGSDVASGVYATFDPQHAFRRLGIFTLLKEIEYAIDSGKQYYYLGYSYEGTSFYDYKKRFRGTERYDWKGVWESWNGEL